MSRSSNGEYVVVSGGHSVLQPSFATDLSHDEAIQKIKELMYTNNSLQEALKKNSELLRTFIPRVAEMESQQKQKDDMIEVYRQRAQQLIADLRDKVSSKDAIIAQLEPKAQNDGAAAENLTQELRSELGAQQDKYSKLQGELHKHQQQIERLKQEKAAILEDNKAVRGQMWTVVDQEETQMTKTREDEGSSTIPTTVDQHRVTTETLPSEATETIFDDVAAPPSPQIREMQLKIESLQGSIAVLQTKYNERTMELDELRSRRGRDEATAAAVEAGGQAERNLQQERAAHREEVHMLKQAIQEYKAQIQNIGQGSDFASLRQQVQLLLTKTNQQQEDIENKDQQITMMGNSIGMAELEISHLQRRAQHLVEEGNSLKKKIKDLEGQLSNRQAQEGGNAAGLQKQNQELQTMVTQMSSELDAVKREKSSIEQQYTDLVSDHHTLLQNNAQNAAGQHPTATGDNSEELNRLTATVLQLEEGMAKKDRELTKKETEINKKDTELKQIEEDVSVLRAQVDIYKADFDAERQAREAMNSDKVRLEEELTAMQFRNQELQDENTQISQAQIQDLQRRHVATMNRPGAHNYPGPMPVYTNTPHTSTAATTPTTERLVQGNVRSQMTQEQIFHCPLCQQAFVDTDSLQVHCMDCNGN